MPPFASPSEAILAAVLLLGILISWAIIGQRISRQQPLVPLEPRYPVPWTLVDLLIVLAIYVLAPVISFDVARQWFGLDGSYAEIIKQPQGQIALLGGAILGGAIACCAIFAICIGHAGATAADLGFQRKQIGKDIVRGWIAFFAAAPVVYGIQFLFLYWGKIKYEHPLVRVLHEGANPTATWLAIIAAVVAAPIVEELLIRVLLQGWLEKVELRLVSSQTANDWPIAPTDARNSDLQIAEAAVSTTPTVLSTIGLAGLPLGTIPIWTSSLIFALMHWGHGAAPVPLFLFALVLGYLYHRTHRILPSAVAHFALNSVSMLMLFLSPGPVAN